jgi:hypothetical protein
MDEHTKVTTPVPPTHHPKSFGLGATEDQVDMRDTIPQRIDNKGTKIEDAAGDGKHDSSGG